MGMLVTDWHVWGHVYEHDNLLIGGIEWNQGKHM